MAAGAYGEQKEDCINRTYPAFEDYRVLSSSKEDCDDFDNTCEGYIGFRPGDQITMYTFGEPRVGDLTFASTFDSMIKNSYRVVFRRDIVPHLPACAKDQSWLGEGEVSRPCDANAQDKPYHHSTEIW
ncbi:unnamed protein product [Nippostrongylus brasiliensis]|uniref:Lipase_3 domain-containing protein n=1 Tax=Nippostrongylus brasiliensis TaxID=27835 RepID=A0A0N4XE78_NIPBR|nr:unnamed protein product [Nippostrongylus brasiliensis]